ncbi:PEP/pyruvate-binding domain-containing protein [Desulfonatronovibrio hydrogenovorans]|uniref:PEP/pyruvate-binding domain-containing protein n=1 Tax=Desulfonatronovibrio hydrogenovorans TaxID=53245 RepID=UPI00054D2FAA|nr:PEP/pyruvate-binding domain-containing protein [Desulfonatronovibrio hydrogenovorans]
MLKFLDLLFDKFKIRMRIEDIDDAPLKKKYEFFKSLLSNNNQALALINDLENLLLDHKPFDYDDVVNQCEQLIGVVYEIAEDMNAISGGKYPGLFSATEKLGIAILKELIRKNKPDKSKWTIPLASLSRENQQLVGNKAANLAEISNRAHLPTPRGFSVTAYACHHFLKQSGLYGLIKEEMKGLDVRDTKKLESACFGIQKKVMDATLPAGIHKAITMELDSLISEFGPDIRLAVRSSAVGEDSQDASFAGQHSSVLNVAPESFFKAYKEVVAGTFNPRAVFYRRSKGYRDLDVLMSVLCLMMVDARASGCLYTADPNDSTRNDLLINANWGLGVSVVDGSMSTDYWRISREDRQVISQEISEKKAMLVMGGEYDLKKVKVPASQTSQACLAADEISRLVTYGLKLEKYFGHPLDMEWALDQNSNIFILQARPLQRFDQDTPGSCQLPSIPDHEQDIILSGGMTASPGTACGPAHVLGPDQDLSAVAQGSILVAPQTSPDYVPAMSRITGIITDVGSVTGHMASVAREFGIPTLVGTSTGTKIIAHLQVITLDATRQMVYRGRAESILKFKPPVNIMKDSPVFKLVRESLKKIVPLHLVDPGAKDFSPQGCQTLHDIVRFCHEMAMQEMFRLGEELQGLDKYMAVRLETDLPLNIHVLDLGGGVEFNPDGSGIGPDQISSIPLKALLKGMSHEDVRWSGDHPQSRLLDVVEYAIHRRKPAPRQKTPKAEPAGINYVIISDKYVNFNARLGYNFVTIDSFCSSRVNDNYIKLSFKGGAADIGPRTRRAKFISMILRKLGFKIMLKGDMLLAEMKKYDCPRIEHKLDLMGRMLGSIRLLDMGLADDGDLPWYVDEFLRGNYTFKNN